MIQSSWETDFERAAQVLRDGGVLLHETETVCGLACDATNPEAVEKIYAIKQRDPAKPLLVLCADREMRSTFHSELSEKQQELLSEIEQRYLGEPVTVVFPEAQKLAANLLPENGSIGIRIPQLGSLQRLIQAAGLPLASTSANLSGGAAVDSLAEVNPVISAAIRAAAGATLALQPGEKPSGTPSKIFLLKANGFMQLR